MNHRRKHAGTRLETPQRLSYRRRARDLAAGLEVVSELSEVYREACQAFGEQLIAALGRCNAGIRDLHGVCVCADCLQATAILRRQAQSVAVARKAVEGFVIEKGRQHGVAIQPSATAAPNGATTAADAAAPDGREPRTTRGHANGEEGSSD
jgi:hypothetical protein